MTGKPEIIAIVGPTASGKTRRAVATALMLDGEIISGDSRQVYRGMTIGTGKDLADYEDVPYHLIDIADAGEKYNLHRYLADFNAARRGIESRGKMPILCGGTGMYVESALSGLAMPEVERNEALRAELNGKSLEQLTEILKKFKTLHNTTDVDTVDRALRAIEIQMHYESHPEDAMAADRSKSRPLDSLIIGVDIPREERRIKISRRLDSRLQEGMVEEVKGLIESGIKPEDLIYYGLEYKFVTLYVIGRLTYEEMRNQLEIAIHQFAKRQMTWFRGMERRGFRINWLPFDLSEEEWCYNINRLIENYRKNDTYSPL